MTVIFGPRISSGVNWPKAKRGSEDPLFPLAARYAGSRTL